ncbi:uncharacterized protein [Penaeus vannamei]|uniref:uncharacterized protein n=1 Tax=Penaeus vannamei TaxID=6689 RepID=UPI00387F8DEF
MSGVSLRRWKRPPGGTVGSSDNSARKSKGRMGRPLQCLLRRLPLAVLLLGALPAARAEGEQCGRPGRPVNGTVSTSGRFYFPGERVAYKCLEGFVLFGADERTCHKNGTWSDEVPLCDFNLARGKRALQSATLWSYVPEMAVDGNPDTCSFTPRGPDPRWWQVHLGHKFNVMSVGVTISPGSFQEFTIYVIELLTDNKALYKPCTTFKGVFQTHKAIFQCNDGLGHPGQFVYIRDDREEQEYFGLCEVEVFAFRERIPCGEPEVPVEGEVEREGETKAMYTCRAGFRLEGDPVLTCSSKGKWEGQAPRCKESQCPPPGHVSHGFIEVANFRGVYGYGTVATYSCNPGYVLQGNSTRTCDHSGKWTLEPPSCQAVTCGPPPVFANARYTLLNGSTHWNGIAVYSCADGFRLHRDTGDTVSTCMDSGSWKFINVTCIPVEAAATAAGVRRGSGRALTFDQDAAGAAEPQGTQGLVVALAIMAGLLTAAMLVVGVLLARRHLISGPGSLRSLVRSSPTKDATLYGAMVGPRHHDVSNTVSASSVAGTTPSSLGPMGGPGAPPPRGALFQQNLLANLPLRPPDQHSLAGSHGTAATASELDDDPNYAQIPGQEPPYERVRTRSEHSYETLRKKSFASDLDSEAGSALDDKDSVGYESLKDAKGKDSGYETVREKDHDYETVKSKEPGYETLKGAADHGYETVREAGPRHHGYETLKPKPPPPRTEGGAGEGEDTVPDILQNLSSGAQGGDVPPEIMALYARVDKTKKRRRAAASDSDSPLPSAASSPTPPDAEIPPSSPSSDFSHAPTSSGVSSASAHSPVCPSISSTSSTASISEPPTDVSFVSEASAPAAGAQAARELIRKFNRLTSDEEAPFPRSRQGSVASDTGSLRPLPPLPKDSSSPTTP